MPSSSPIGDGFRQAIRDPALVLAEIAWRWTFGVAALALTIACFSAYLNSLTVSRIEHLALRSHSPWLVVGAIGHILYGSGPHLARIAAILLPSLFVLWIAAASFGRTATLKALLRRDRIALGPQLGLNILRASLTLASLIGYLGALILAGHAAAADGDNRVAIFLLIFVVLATVISIVRSRVNWFFYLAEIFAARDDGETFTAISKAAGLFRRNARRFLGTGAVFGTIHGVLFAFAAIAWLLPLSLTGKLPASVTAVLLATITLSYFALCDFLYIARLAAYIALDEQDRTPPAARVAAAPEAAPPVSGLPSPSDVPPMAEPGLSEGSTS